MNATFRGTVVPAITPYKADGSLDIAGVEAVFAHFDAHPGVDGIFVTGAMGDYSSLSVREREEIMNLALRMNLKKDWLPNTSTLERESSVALARFAADAGIGVIGVILPKECAAFEDVLSFMREILSLGVEAFIYQTGNSPYPLSIEEYGEIVSLGGVIGIKDSCSGRDMYRHVRYITEYGDRCDVIQGIEMLYLSSLSVGAKGVIGGGLNVYPQWLGDIRAKYLAGDVAGAAARQAEVNRTYEAISKGGSTLAAMKYFLSLSGVPIGTAGRKPEAPLTDGLKAYVRDLHARLSSE